jgi:hypothetical protein
MFAVTSPRSVSALLATLTLCLTTACTEDAPTGIAATPVVAEASLSRAAATATATITFETRVPGYSRSGNNGWIQVTATCGGGGKVVRAGTRNACTDRVARLEPIRVTISSKQSRRSRVMAFTGVSAANGFAAGSIVTLPQTATFVVSPDPTFDNVHVAVALLAANSTPLGSVQERRVPIGIRQ